MATKILTVAEIAANPEAYGIAFRSAELHKGTGAAKVAVGSAPLLTVIDFGLFEANFPGVLLKHSNGQSVRVHAQGLCRNALVADRNVSADKMTAMQIEGICLGKTVSVTVKTVEKIVEVAVDMTVERKASLIAKMVDRGMSVAEATEIVNSEV